MLYGRLEFGVGAFTLGGFPAARIFAWLGRRIAVFVDGAFWHGHPDYYWGQSGKFWDEKIDRNRSRDEKVTKELVDEGWIVLRLWDFEIQEDVARCVVAVRRALGLDSTVGATTTADAAKDMTGRAESDAVADPDVRAEAAARLQEIADQIVDLANAIKGSEGERGAIDEVVAELRAVQSTCFGARGREKPRSSTRGSAR